MASDRITRAIDHLLDEAADALTRDDWPTLLQRAETVLALDAGNEEGRRLAEAAKKALSGDSRAGRLVLDELVDEVADLRPLGDVAARVLRLTEDDRSSADELAHVIGTDQALTAKILRIANSAFYTARHRVATVRDAVVRVGVAEVRSATLASCVIDAMSPHSNVLKYRDFWEFSLTVGMLAEILARSTSARHDEAFTAGVLHNIGLLALDQHRPRELQASLAYAAEADVRLHEAELKVVGFTDAELGGALAAKWSLPDSLISPIAQHAFDVDRLPERDSLTGWTVRSRMFARSFGLSDGVERPKRVDPPSEWQMPPLSTTMQMMGGADGLLARVDGFLRAVLSG